MSGTSGFSASGLAGISSMKSRGGRARPGSGRRPAGRVWEGHLRADTFKLLSEDVLFDGGWSASYFQWRFGDFTTSDETNPLFCWDVSPKDFSVSNIRTILDAKKTLGIRQPMVGFAKLSPVHRNRQILTFRVTTQNHRHATERFPQPVTEKELAVCGAHYCEVIYEDDVMDMWRFCE